MNEDSKTNQPTKEFKCFDEAASNLFQMTYEEVREIETQCGQLEEHY